MIRLSYATPAHSFCTLLLYSCESDHTAIAGLEAIEPCSLVKEM